jgi:malonyl-CoA O-methyltransferase
MGAAVREPEEAARGEPVRLKREIRRVGAGEGYRIWAETYDLDLNPLLALEMRILNGRLGDLAGRVLLDVACGTGRWTTETLSRGGRAFGVDACAEMLFHARRKKGLEGRLAVADMLRLPVRSRSIDFALLSFALSYTDDPAAVLCEVSRVTRPGAAIVFSDFHADAMQAGWKRTFRRGSELFELESFPHTCATLQRHGFEMGWELEEVLEPCFGDPEREIMRDAGREDQFEQAASRPAVLIIVWRKP